MKKIIKAYIYNLLGNIKFYLEDYQGALEDFNKAIEIKPNLGIAYNNRASIYRRQKNNERALINYNQAISHNPKLSIAYSNRGAMYRKQGQMDLALADFNQAISIDPNLTTDYIATAYIGRGQIYHGQKNYLAAISDYQKLLSWNLKSILATPNDNIIGIIKNNIGLIKYEMEDLSEAQSQFEQAININPKYAEAQLALAVVLFTQAKNEPFFYFELVEKALKLDKNLKNLDFLKTNLWGEKLINNTKKLLSTSRMKQFQVTLPH